MDNTVERKDFIGLSQNYVCFIGKVQDDPRFVEKGEESCAFLTLRTQRKAQQQNGQWVDLEQKIPITVMDSTLVTRLVKPYIKAGRQLIIHGYYQTWVEGEIKQHTFVAERIILGAKGFYTAPSSPVLPSS